MAKQRADTETIGAQDDSATAVAEVVEVVEAPVAPPGFVFEVEYRGTRMRIRAANDREAWAIFCDRQKVSPSPKVGKVFRDGVQVYPPVKA